MDTHTAELLAGMARVEEGIARCHDEIQRNHAVSVKRLDNHGDRVASLEHTRAKQVGASKVLAGILAAGASLLGWFRLGS